MPQYYQDGRNQATIENIEVVQADGWDQFTWTVNDPDASHPQYHHRATIIERDVSPDFSSPDANASYENAAWKASVQISTYYRFLSMSEHGDHGDWSETILVGEAPDADDVWETAVWTTLTDPTVSFPSGSVTVDAAGTLLRVRKVGRLVFFLGHVAFSAVSSPSGRARLAEIPYVPVDVSWPVKGFKLNGGAAPTPTLFNIPMIGEVVRAGASNYAHIDLLRYDGVGDANFWTADEGFYFSGFFEATA